MIGEAKKRYEEMCYLARADWADYEKMEGEWGWAFERVAFCLPQ